MKKYGSILRKSLLAAAVALFIGCALDEEWYSEVTPGTFFKNKSDVLKALYRPFTHAYWYESKDRWYLQEYTADQYTQPKRGSDWYDGGIFYRLHYHTWTPDDGHIWETWRGTTMGIALAVETKKDLSQLNYPSLGLTETDKADHLNQLNTLIAYFYLRGLDYFGHFPIFLNPDEPVEGRSRDTKVYATVEQMLSEAIRNLHKKKQGEEIDGISMGAAATLLARLYFNAESYIGEEHFTECAEICEDILDGEYGYYDLDATWQGPHCFRNNKSAAMIWSYPSQMNYMQYNWQFIYTVHKNSVLYFGIDNVNAYNGHGCTPSLKPDGTPYAEYRLGSAYAKFNDADLRKRQYVYKGSGEYEGMFLTGNQVTPGGVQITGRKEYDGKPLVFVDYVARMSELPAGGDPSSLNSTMANGEENSLVRPLKVPVASELEYRWEADEPVLRLEEVYYMLAECRLREGRKKEAAELINKVRRRAFENYDDPDPATEENLDKYRMVDEWGIEFLGEGRRRTDLIRWNLFTTESWWDHKPSDASRRRFPVPTKAISGNNKLENDPI